ncbi:polysaccharide lyase family 7 protein [Neiella sp. HB171785]|uniref:Polysaccharide lyase family 7 protein n=1 Tax=Neiella litorisoli TaxID=2771431 RepID=A0A8J6QTS6_9GAMM|nr:polysaccharide lyase family 7 protein [Neiella litorisoli]MBD1389107.1 polysaccharide lyase family 7 protein [Neiella litorisoli]
MNPFRSAFLIAFSTLPLVTACGGGGGSSAPSNPATPVTPPAEPEVCTSPTATTLVAAYDDGSHDGHSPSDAIDGDLSDGSRWSSEGDGKWLIVDLGEAFDIRQIHTAWYKADERASYFDLEYSLDGQSWQLIGDEYQSTLGVIGFETWPVSNADGRYIRLTGHGNSAADNNWNSLLEIAVSDCGATHSVTQELQLPETPTPPSEQPGQTVTTPDGTPSAPLTSVLLDSSLPPSGNFDLSRWYLSVPTDTDGNGKSDSIYEAELNAGYQDNNYFYTAADGGMTFVCPIYGYKTSTNTTYTRVELRGMLRAGDTSIRTQGVNQNNWVFSSAPSAAQIAAGGVDGVLKATLAVNHVTETVEAGSDYRVGRVVIGQIHADDDEPIRLYYRKLPGNDKGSIYFAHEPIDRSDLWFELIGSKDSDAANPVDGIALNEKFSYEIHVVGNVLSVSILRDGKDTITQSISMNGSGYDAADQYMYFKAGVYIQDKLEKDFADYASDDPRLTDYAQVTFYALEASHN